MTCLRWQSFQSFWGDSSIANAELIMIDELGELTLSSDSIEIKSRNGQKIVEGVVYVFSNGVKKVWLSLLSPAVSLEVQFKFKNLINRLIL